MSSIFPNRLLTNITIQVPNSTTQHGNEHILCLPITKNYWPSVAAIIIFFATNYLAHAATVKSSPGDDSLLQACNAILALFFPMSGLLRALNAIVRLPILARNELEKACRAGALCMVVRAPHWRPKLGQKLSVGVVIDNQDDLGVVDPEGQPERGPSLPIRANMITYLPSYAREHPSIWIHFDSVWARSRVDLRLTRVHGTFDLPEGYEFAIVPRNTFLISQVVSNIQGDSRLSSEISAGYSVLKAVASLIQVVAAFTTLLSHRPDLVRRWGYASYHLTVIPYLAMTLVNLISNMVSPDYSCLYMIRSETMVEAERVGGRFEGEIAQMISLLPVDAMKVEDPAWSGVTRKDIQDFSVKISSTYSDIYASKMVIRLLDLIHGKKKMLSAKKKRLSAKDAEVVQLEVVAQFNAPPPTTDDLEMSVTHASPEDIVAKRVDSTDEYQIQIPHAPQPSLGKGFVYTIRRVLEDLSSAQSGKTNPLFTMLQNIEENKKRLRASRPSGSSLHRAAILYKYALQGLLIPISPDGNTDLVPVRSATIYYPNCQRFLRMDDFANLAEINKESFEVSQLRAPSPITERGEAMLASSISNIRTQLQLPARRPTSTTSITELEALLRSPVITRISERTAWAILVEISIGSCILGLFFGLIAILTKFRAGESSTTERGIMMTWLASGLYGFCLPLLSTMELLKILFLFPMIISLCLYFPPAYRVLMPLEEILQISHVAGWKQPFKLFWKSLTKYLSATLSNNFGPQPVALFLYVLFFVPLGIFIPPVWGFVLVGRMLTEWGDCVRLY
ncbi:hypothetical protein NHQ30_000989 [Ciborinia camelliae]|nr:hypothetical protein NHQ30_000989 [Ciborinia camelliae]